MIDSDGQKSSCVVSSPNQTTNSDENPLSNTKVDNSIKSTSKKRKSPDKPVLDLNDRSKYTKEVSV